MLVIGMRCRLWRVGKQHRLKLCKASDEVKKIWIYTSIPPIRLLGVVFN
jgi:hypothetical protein